MSYTPNPVVQSQRDHIHVNITEDKASVSDNGANRCTFDNVYDAGQGGLSLSTGKIALLAGKRYKLSAYVVTSDNQAVYFYDYTNGVQISPYYNLSTVNFMAGGPEFIIEPTGNMDIGLGSFTSTTFNYLASGGCSMLVEKM